MPMQPPQPAWWNRPPAPMRLWMAPISARFWRIWREVGLTSKETRWWAIFPFTISAGTQKSRRPGLAEEPMYAW